MDTSVVDDLKTDLIKITKIGTVILVLVALLLLAGNCALEWYKWRCMKRHLQYTREAWTSDPTLVYVGTKSAPTINMSDHNLLMLQASSQHPLLTKIANRVQALLRLSPSQHIHLQWFFHYVFHPPALACFLIGFFGLLSVQIQLIAISPLADKYSKQAVASADNFSNTIVASVNSSMYNQSSAYANDVNTRVDNIQSTINDGLFGWVNGTTTTLNDTINTFYTDIQDAVNTVFSGTILEEPVQEFIRCFIGSKVDAIESALTFLHDNLHVNVPRVNETVLVLSPADVDEVTRPVALAAIGGGEGNNDGLVGRLVNAYVSSLKKERIMFAIFMGLWGFVVLIAFGIIFWHAYGRDWLHAYRKRKWQKQQRVGPDGIVVPFRDGQPDNGMPGNGDIEKPKDELHSFSPISPPKFRFFSSIHSASFQNKEPHPLSTRNPEYEKSWDDFLDQADANKTNASQTRTKGIKVSAPKVLVALNRKGRERFIGDGESSDSSPNLVQNEAKGGSLWLRMQGLVRKKDKTESPVDFPDILDPDTSERSRPTLSIDPSATSNDSPVARPEPSTEQPVPSSAWSVSPGPATKITWLKKASLSGPFQPKSRRTASVPSDTPIRDSMTPAAGYDDAQFPVPLHHGFERPFPPSPPLESLQYGSSRYPRIGATLPPVRPVDPFATPFDDEYRVTITSPSPPPVPASSEKGHINPFAVAI
ncbi:hypothetical protein QCA50_004110 [Cerrena zonata]|uniref:Plasma membrane fusion protein PRM1 n=1 Tax=Cerrena zonata TaxID=2478898 RepID=A0AAW0GTB4_9APHY